MKRILIIGLPALFLISSVGAFDLSLAARVGYSTDTGQDVRGSYITGDKSYDFLEYRNLFSSAGKGTRFLGGVDISPIPGFSVEIMGGYLLGNSHATRWHDYYSPPVDVDPIHTGANWHITTSFFPLSLTAKGYAELGRFRLYGGAGPSFGFLARSEIGFERDQADINESGNIEHVYSAGIGYHGVLGVEFALGNNIALVYEVKGEQLTFRDKQSIMTGYTYEGTDALDDLTVSEKETIYVDDASGYRNKTFDPDKPTETPKERLSADNLGFTFGIRYRVVGRK